MKKKIVMIIARQKFRDEELLVPKAHFEKQGFQVTVASSSLDPSTGMLGATIKPDLLLSEVKPEDYDGVIFVGGSGAQEYWNNPLAHEIAQKTQQSGKILAAICIAPVTLAKARLLKGKSATVWSSEIKQLQDLGVKLSSAPVVRDEKIITANGPEAALDFAQTIVEAMATDFSVK